MVSSMPRPHLSAGKDPVPIVQEAGWAPGPVCMAQVELNNMYTNIGANDGSEKL